MKHCLVFFFFVLTPLLSVAQHDSTTWDRTMDGVYKKSLCAVDTVVTVYTQKSLVIKDSTNWTYEFAAGKRTYLEIKIRTTFCWCVDCSYADHILIDITDLKSAESVEINSTNTVWITWNSLMMSSSETTFAGTLAYKNVSDFTFEIFKYVEGQSWLTYDGIKVERD
jgi:hypothetical protein